MCYYNTVLYFREIAVFEVFEGTDLDHFGVRGVYFRGCLYYSPRGTLLSAHEHGNPLFWVCELSVLIGLFSDMMALEPY